MIARVTSKHRIASIYGIKKDSAYTNRRSLNPYKFSTLKVNENFGKLNREEKAKLHVRRNFELRSKNISETVFNLLNIKMSGLWLWHSGRAQAS